MESSPAHFGSTDLAFSTHYELNQGDYVELMALQSTGVARFVFSAPPQTPQFGMVKLP